MLLNYRLTGCKRSKEFTRNAFAKYISDFTDRCKIDSYEIINVALHTGKREVSNYSISTDNEEFDHDFMRDERDRRAIDEEDDEDFLQELDTLRQEVRREYENVRFR